MNSTRLETFLIYLKNYRKEPENFEPSYFEKIVSFLQLF